MWHHRLLALCYAANIGAAFSLADTFKVAQVKPHFGCKSDDGQDRVRQRVADLASADTGLITLIEMEFQLAQPTGYTAFGAACGRHKDPIVVLVNEAQFTVVSTMGATLTGNYSAMPYIGGGKGPEKGDNMCVSDPLGSISVGNKTFPMGSRPYAGAVLLHKASGKEICMISGTLPHCLYKWADQFITDVDKTCGNRQLLWIGDTNAGCELPGLYVDNRISFDDILANHSKADWGPCHDPALQAEPTCCNDFPDHPYPRYWYDRTVVCRGGRVEDFKVDSAFICKNSHAEHLSTTATIHLASPSDVQSQSCLDHPNCAKAYQVEKAYGDAIPPVDGICCPTSTGNMSLACCSAVALV